MDPMLKSYLECALWSSNDQSRDDGGDPLDKNYGIEDIDTASVEAARKDCEAFLAKHADLIGDRLDRAGHDLWLNRNGHGAGFWDGDWPEPGASVLDKSATELGEINPCVGDDGRIYFE